MSQFNLTKPDHFANVKFTPKQIIDVYNLVHFTSKSEQNLVFKETGVHICGSINPILQLASNEIAYCHWAYVAHRVNFRFGFYTPVPNTSWVHFNSATQEPTQLVDSLFDYINWLGGENALICYTKFAVV